jgi:hypothetical protein
MKKCTSASSSTPRNNLHGLWLGLFVATASQAAGAEALPFCDVDVGQVLGWTEDGRYFLYRVETKSQKKKLDSAAANRIGTGVVAVDGFSGARLPFGAWPEGVSCESREGSKEGNGIDFERWLETRSLVAPVAITNGGKGWAIVYKHDSGFGQWKGKRYWYDHGVEGEMWPGRTTLRVVIRRWGREFSYVRRTIETDSYSFGMHSVWAFPSPDYKRMAWVFTMKGHRGTEMYVGPTLDVEITPLGGPRIELAVPFSDVEKAWMLSKTLLSNTRYAPVKVYAATNKNRVSTEIFARTVFLPDARSLGSLLGVPADSVNPLTWKTSGDVVLAFGKDVFEQRGD